MKRRNRRPGSRGGRVGRPRSAKGKLKLTPERLLKKMALIGDPNGDDSPIGVMVAHKIIGPDEENAAAWFTSLHKFRHGNPNPKSSVGDPGGESAFDSEVKTQQWHEVNSMLSRSQRDAVENVAVYQRMPQWLLAHLGLARPRVSDEWCKRVFLTGLGQIVLRWARKEAA